MLSTQAAAPARNERPTVVVDLIGDLDATLGSQFADTLSKLADAGTTDVYVTTRHVAMSSNEGLATLGGAVDDARRRGCAIAVVAGNRRMRAAFTSARIALAADSAHTRGRHSRHLMMARHAPAKSLARKV